MRLLIRFFGLLVLAGGFAALVADGTRSLALGTLVQTPLGETVQWLSPSRFELLKPAVQRFHPLLWDPVLVHLFRVPTWAVLSVCGLIVIYLGRPRAPRIGFSSRP